MPVRSGTFKIFIGNLSDNASGPDLQGLFEKHGTVVESDVVKNYGFVHMEDEKAARDAISELNGHHLHGKPMVVEASTGLNKRGQARKGKTKIFVGNLVADSTQVEELRSLFEVYGTVTEADVVGNYAFVHMEAEENAIKAIKNLNGYQLHGREMRVQMSTSQVRQIAGMGNPELCYRCGSRGHWSKECMKGMRNQEGPERYRDMRRYDPYPPPPPPSYMRERMMASRYRDDYYDTYDEELYERRYLPPPRPRSIYPNLPPLRRELRELREIPPMRPLPPMRDPPMRDPPMRDLQMRDLPMRDLPMRDLPMRDLPMRDLPMRDPPMRDPPMRDYPPLRDDFYYERRMPPSDYSSSARRPMPY